MPIVHGTQTGGAGLAYGLNGVTDWTVQQAFLDVFKTARTWHGHTEIQWGAYRAEDLERMGVLDDEGWITRLPAGVDRVETFILTEMPAEARYTAGTYRLSYDGAGQINVYGAEIVSQSNGEIWFNYIPNGESMVVVSISDTDPQNTGDYLRNIEVVKQEHIPAFEAGEIFNPLWLDLIRDAHSLRFMDWQETNNSTLQNWSERPTPGTYSYTEGVPVEVMVALANATGTEPWFNMPWDATDDYIRQFASYVQANLNPELRAHYEMSNEVWNWQFDQAQDAARSATERFGQDLGDGWMQEYGARAAGMASVLDSVYAGAEDQLVKVIATHTAWPGLEESALQAPAWQALSSANAAPYLSFDTYAVTGYFGNSLGTDEKAPAVLDWIDRSEAQARQDAASRGLSGAAADAYFADHRFDLAEDLAIRELRDGSVTGNGEDSLQGIFELFRYHKGVADAHGLDLVMYEGGTHVVGIGEWVHNSQLTEFFNHLNYSDGMGQLYGELLAGWEAAGGTLFNAFVDVARPSQWGSWGALRHLEDSTPKHAVLESFADSHPAPDAMKDGYEGTSPVVPFDPPLMVPETDDPDEPEEEDVSVEDNPDQDTPVVSDSENPPIWHQPPTSSPDAGTEVREYVFGNSLFSWATGDPELSVAHWMNLMANEAGSSYTTAIQTGMLSSHDNLPPNPHVWIEGVESPWDPEAGQSFADADFNQITISEVNFTQSRAPDQPDYSDPDTTPAQAALDIIAWVDGRAPNATINLYETWPSLESFADSFPPSHEAFTAWLEYMTGDWHEWWVSLYEIIREERPDITLRLISVGPQIARLIADLGLDDLRAEDLFIDEGGHGSPTLYFLAATIHYTALFGTPPETGFELPDSLHSQVAENYAGLVGWLSENAVRTFDITRSYSQHTITEVAHILVPDLDLETHDRDSLADAPLEGSSDTGDAAADVGRNGVVVLSGAQSNYTLTMSAGDTISLEDRRVGGDGIQTFSNDVTLEFADGSPATQQSSFSVDDFSGMASLGNEAMDSLTELYIAYFNRAPDATGLSFWGDKLAQGMSMREIAEYFFDQPEPRELYGEDINLARFVSAVYNNVFGRAPDSDGFRFWLDALQNDDSITPATFIMEILEGAKAETGSIEDAQYLANKVVLGTHFGVTRGMSNVDTARSVMSQFDGSSESFDTAISEIETAYADAVDIGDGDGEFLIKLVGSADDDDDDYADEIESDAQFMRLT